MAVATAVNEAIESDEFLGESYEVPESGGNGGKYLKLKEGTTHFRVLSRKALKGWEYWTAEGKPSRLAQKPTKTPSDIRIGDDGKPDRIKHFWAMTVWDYTDKSVKILNITQATIQKAIIAFVKDPDFGHPTQYDLKISRSGSGIETEYNVMPLHKLCPPEAIAALEKTPVYLEALMHNADPFSPESAQYAPAVPEVQYLSGDKHGEFLGMCKENGWTSGTLKVLLNDMGIKGNNKIPLDRVSEVTDAVQDPATLESYRSASGAVSDTEAQKLGIPF